MNRMRRGIVRVPLTAREVQAIALRRDGAAIDTIAATLDVSPRRARQLVQAATRKIEQERAANSFADPLDCPIGLLPIPANRRSALLAAGYSKLRDIACRTDEQLLHVPGVGRAAVQFLRSIGMDEAIKNETSRKRKS